MIRLRPDSFRIWARVRTVYVLGSNLGHTGFAGLMTFRRPSARSNSVVVPSRTMSGTRTDPVAMITVLNCMQKIAWWQVGMRARPYARWMLIWEQSRDCYQGFLDRYSAAYRFEIQRLPKLARGEESICTVRDAYEAQRVAVACELCVVRAKPIRLDGKVTSWPT